MKHTECEVLIAGASFAGIGAAAAAKAADRSVIVVERTAAVGREYIDTFNPGRGSPRPATDFGRSFREAVVARNIMLEDGSLHLPALHPALCLAMKETGIKTLFLTEIVHVAESRGRYAVTLLTASGLRQVTADEIVDTTTERLTEPGNLFAPVHRRLNAYLHHPAVAAPPPAPMDDAMSVTGGRFPAEVILRVCVPPRIDWLHARQWLYRYWEARTEEWEPWTIAAVAGGFESVVRRGPQRLADGWTWLPSEGYDHPLEAIDAGYGWLTREGEAVAP